MEIIKNFLYYINKIKAKVHLVCEQNAQTQGMEFGNYFFIDPIAAVKIAANSKGRKNCYEENI